MFGWHLLFFLTLSVCLLQFLSPRACLSSMWQCFPRRPFTKIIHCHLAFLQTTGASNLSGLTAQHVGMKAEHTELVDNTAFWKESNHNTSLLCNPPSVFSWDFLTIHTWHRITAFALVRRVYVTYCRLNRIYASVVLRNVQGQTFYHHLKTSSL